MKIVIDLPEKTIAHIRSDYGHGKGFYPLNEEDKKIVNDAIYFGTPLPEHHGRLIDADAVIAEATEGMKYPKNHTYMECVIAHINLAPTIIEGAHSEKWESAEENDSLIVDDLIDTSIPVRNCRECKHHVPAEGKEIFGCESWKCEFEKRGE